MTHTSTEQPEALLKLAHDNDDHLTREEMDVLRGAALEIRSLRSRVQELAASQARVPLTDAQIKEGRNAVNDDPDDRPEPWAFREGVKFAERMHGITQEKQG